MPAAKRILIMRPGALGDTIFTEPVIAAIRAKYPQSHIVFAGNTDYAEILRSPHAADDVRSFGSLSVTPAGMSPLGRFELVLAFMTPINSWAGWKGSVCERLVFHDPRPPAGVHIVDHLLGSLEPLGISPVRREPRVDWIEPDARGYVVIHPGSGGRHKLWPAGHWAELIAKIEKPIVLTCGPADADTIAEVTAKTSTQLMLFHDKTIAELARIIAGADVYIGVDSGVTHLAAAVGVRTIAIYGPTDPAEWCPRGNNVHVLRSGASTAAVTPAEVLSAIRAE